MFFSKEMVLFIECGPRKSWFGCSKVTFLQNQERLLPYCLPAQDEQESLTQHYGFPWLREFVFHSVCSIFSPVSVYQRLTSPYT